MKLLLPITKFNVIVNVIFVSCCHLANTNENEYNHCYSYSLGAWQAAVPKFLTERLSDLAFDLLTSNGVMSHPCPGLPCCQISASYSLPFSSGIGQTNRRTDRQRPPLHNAYVLWGRKHNSRIRNS